MKIVIVDYGMGNIRSIISALNFIGINHVELSSEYNVLNSADRLILPGVGSFHKAMDQIVTKNLDKILEEIVLVNNKPLLGICLGMQLLGMSSTEDGYIRGLQFINGNVLRFEENNLKIPHVGFNQVTVSPSNKLYEGLSSSPDFYFTHSYKMGINDKINQSICNYGEDFVASFEYKNIAGVQFHPELSQRNGLRLLNNFILKF